MNIIRFEKILKRFSRQKRKLPLLIQCPNGLLVEPQVKMKFKDDNIFSGEVVALVITWD